jgi:hypothetical protein
LRHLTQPCRYESSTGPVGDPHLRGLDPERLRLIGRLSLTKRLNKVGVLLPATLHCVRHHAPLLIEAFANQCPPVSAGRFANAQQFHDFLDGLVEPDGSWPAYLGDLVRCEFVAAASVWEMRRQAVPVDAGSPLSPGAIVRVRTATTLRLLAYEYNVRELIENPHGTPPASLPPAPGKLAVIARWQGPRLFEIGQDIEDLLRCLAQWTILTFAEDSADLFDAIVVLYERGFVEVEPCVSA